MDQVLYDKFTMEVEEVIYRRHMKKRWWDCGSV